MSSSTTSAPRWKAADATPARRTPSSTRSSPRAAVAVANGDDVASWDGARDLVAQAVDEWGRLDILVNNAGIIRDAMSFKMDEATFDSVINVHLKGHFATCRFAAEHWRDRAKAGEEGLRAASSTPRANRASTASPAS